MAHVVPEGEKEAAYKCQAEEDAEDRPCTKGYLAVAAAPRHVIIVVEKIAHRVSNRLEANVKAHGGF